MARKTSVTPGLEVLARRRPAWLRQRRVGLLMHQASVARDLTSSRDVLHALCGRKLTALFGPQHGITGDKQDNMIESPHGTDPVLRIPVFSLYSETRQPTADMLSHIDTLVIDLQDVGTRVYTFIWTAALALAACAEAGIPVVILDRPNPLGGRVMEGNLINPGFESFVGLHSVPMRHSLTVGEMMSLVNTRLAARPGGKACDLTIVKARGLRRRMLFGDTGLPWVLPSPNMPCYEGAVVYPGQVLLEGTNLSEGRGTTRPFEIWGAPFLDTKGLRDRFHRRKFEGLVLREHAFEPTFHKWQGQQCRGFQIHVTNPSRFSPYLTTLALLQDTVALHGKEFAWNNPPYEYVHDRLPIDILTGAPSIRRAIETESSLRRLAARWEKDLREFGKEASSHRLYPA